MGQRRRREGVSCVDRGVLRMVEEVLGRDGGGWRDEVGGDSVSGPRGFQQ